MKIDRPAAECKTPIVGALLPAKRVDNMFNGKRHADAGVVTDAIGHAKRVPIIKA
ncbi:MAG: hypothetical protein HQ548_03765, partial [Chloroflexi bacterium]|nr:hypothetical protein [Chloroflexota bacterium]